MERALGGRAIDALIVVGTVLNVCCESTVRDAFFRGFRVFLPIGLNTTRHHSDIGFGEFTAEELAGAVYTSLGHRFAHVMNLRELMAQIGAESIGGRPRTPGV
ncbi:isochorismatase family protein [Alicyclobacillus sp. ALC3]|nr:isochorismatase family protein [Alicyclobacillus sp. ALC3]